MPEFNISQWSDFVRGVADPDMANQMKDHLESGSTSARRTVEALRRVAALGRSDHESPVPSGAVQIAKATFSMPRAAAEPKFRRVRCMLAFDSLLEPAAAGARGAQTSHRELTFEAQGYSVDLRLEYEPSLGGFSDAPPERQVVVGQLLRLHDDEVHDDVPRPVSQAPVFMFSGERLIGKAITGRHGEFQVERSPEKLPERETESSAESLSILAGEDYLEMPLVVEPGSATLSEDDTP